MLFNHILPSEATSGTHRIILSGNDHLLIEGHRGLLSYSDDLIRIRLEKGCLACAGSQLVIRCFGSNEITVTGAIRSLEICP